MGEWYDPRTFIPSSLEMPDLMERYPLRIYKKEYQYAAPYTLVCEIDDYDFLSWTRRLRTPGEFVCKANRYSEGMQRFLEAVAYEAPPS